MRRLLTTIPVRKPAKEWWVQVHSSEAYRLYILVLELKEDREIYLVDPTLWDALAAEPCCDGRLLVTAINRQGTLFLWPIRLPGADGKIDEWNRSALEAVERAGSHWIRIAANMNLGAYDLLSAEAANLAPAQWPSLSFRGDPADCLQGPPHRRSRSPRPAETAGCILNLLDQFRAVWLVDFEFSAPPGERPTPVCLVAREYRSGRTIQIFQDDLSILRAPPYPVGPEDLFCAYYASAEVGCHLALGWPVPARILDLYAEFRCLTNGLPTPNGWGLLGALLWFGLNAMSAVEKQSMRDLAMCGGPFTPEERVALLDYCESDVLSLARLLPVMLPRIDLPRALLRGRYMAAAARIERTGIPIDTGTLARLHDLGDEIRGQLISELDIHGMYEGQTFKTCRFADWLSKHDLSWPYLDTGALALDSDTFKMMGALYPEVAPIARRWPPSQGYEPCSPNCDWRQG